MVREGPAEPPPANVSETTEARRARPYGMALTALIVAVVVIIVVYLVMR
ncbi:hypothetical protein [Bradyrhizobium rifense]|nr:hypothetical protein [Bradyrhizobium rifense]